jgi:ATP-dependent DNA helicase RecG
MPSPQNIEYKQSWHDDYLKWVCGFANAIGGNWQVKK